MKKPLLDTDPAKIPLIDPAKRGVLKSPYNHRTRSLVRTFVDLFSNEETKKKIRAQMRDFATYAEVAAYARQLVTADQWNALIAEWFDSGLKCSENAS